MKKLTLVLFVLVAAALIAACRTNPPTSTPVPPTAVVPTALPPAPTAPPLTEAPTAVLPTTQAPQPTAIQVEPTTAPTDAPANPTASGSAANPTSSAASNPPAVVVSSGPLAGLYLAGLRYDPTYPRNQEPLNFYATLTNRTGKDQNYPVCVEVYRAGEPKAFGISNCDSVPIPPGTNEVFAGSWTGTGIRECLAVQARTVLKDLDGDNVFLPFTTTSGASPWTNFQVCP